MEQFRQIGEVLGSLRALMAFQDDFQFNRRQCSLLYDIFTLAFLTIAEEIKLNLKLEERNTKWNALENPLRELYRIFKEGELYIKQCMDRRDWWVKAINLHQNKDCVENFIHNLLCHFPSVIEAIETAGEIAGLDEKEMQRRRVALARKYEKEWNDPKLFQFRFGKQYLIPRDIANRFETAWREDRWNLVEALREKKSSECATKNRLAVLLIKKIIGSESTSNKLFPSSVLYGGDYLVRRRLGAQYKEIQWLGDNFVLRHFYVDVEPSNSEFSTFLSLSHPNILQFLCGFYDEDKKEVMLAQELMNKDLGCYLKENIGSRRRILFSLPVVVDLMYQIARGMEYLHSQKITHGELNPSNIFLKAKNNTEGFFHLKISGYGLSSVKARSSPTSSPKPVEPKPNPVIWYAPEVLQEQERAVDITPSKYTVKADVYSFGMLCFQILTGKVPFEDGHLQGEKMSRNIRAGERPLFPFSAPKYLVNLTKKCWHTDPKQRPSFSSICRILRYVKKLLVMNPDVEQPEIQFAVADYCEIESWFLKKFGADGNFNPSSVAQIPFQMFAYRLAEKDKTILSDKNGEIGCEVDATCRDETNSIVDDPLLAASDAKSVTSDVRSCSDVKSVCSDMRSVCSEIREKRSIIFEVPPKRSISITIPEKKSLQMKKSASFVRDKKSPGGPKAQTPRPPALNRGYSEKITRENRTPLLAKSPGRRRQRTAATGHTSD